MVPQFWAAGETVKAEVCASVLGQGVATVNTVCVSLTPPSLEHMVWVVTSNLPVWFLSVLFIGGIFCGLVNQ